jgi:DNA-binding NarL/FixJ family response regulator
MAAGNDVIRAIHALLAGEAVLSPSILQEILKYVNKGLVKETNSSLISKLNSRELQLLKFAAKGMSNKNIAVELHISESTVKFNLVELFTKLNVSSRTEAVVTGLREGLITFSDLD